MDPENRAPPHSHNQSPMGTEHKGPPPPTPPKHTLTPPPPSTPPKHHLPEEQHYPHKYPEEDYQKHGRHDGGYYGRDRHRSTICGFITIFLLLAGVTVLIVYLVYRPQNPKFTVLGVAIFNLNNTSPPYITTTMQFSLISKNPNKRVSIYYDHLSAFVTYHDQMITHPVALPPLYHHKHTTVQLAPILGGDGGNAVAVSSDASYGLSLDEEYGVVGLRLVLLGKLRWKAGAIVTRRYGVHVKCDVLVRLNKGFVGQVPLVAPPKCDFDA